MANQAQLNRAGQAYQSAAQGQLNPSPQDKQPEKKKGDHVTYTPGPEDLTSVEWRGVTFFANMPKFIEDAAHVEAALSNKYFHVGDFSERDAVKTREEAPVPKTSDQYIAHFFEWLKKVRSVAELDRHWAAEEQMRIACGVGTDDYDRMHEMTAPKREFLEKAAREGQIL